MSLHIVELDREWFEGRHYSPRVRVDDATRWFLLEDRFRPRSDVPTGPAAEPRSGRAALREAFEASYREWGLPSTSAVQRSLETIQTAESAVVVTGQQPGFLGGPLLVLFKALTAVAAARRYEATTGRPCVPVFWVAGDDHDLDEIRSAHFPAGGGGEVTFTYPARADRRPVSDYSVDESSLEVLDAARTHLAGRRFADLTNELVDLYRERRLAGAFAAVLSRLLAPTGLLVIDPVQLRPLAAPLWRRVIERPREVLDRVAQGRDAVEASGIRPFVSGRLPLFLLIEGQRHHLEPDGDNFKVSGGGPRIQRAELLATLEENPKALSTGALLRPLLQQFTLPCVLTIGGPAEVGYFSQLAPLAELMGIDPPAIALRMGATLLDGQAARVARRYDLRELARARSAEQLLLTNERPDGLEAITGLAERVEETLSEAVSELPPEAPGHRRLASRPQSIAKDIRGFGDRLARIWAQSREVELGRVERLWNQVFPGGVLQERRWSTLHFVSRHGTEWIEELLDALSGDPLKICHRFVTFEPNED